MLSTVEYDPSIRGVCVFVSPHEKFETISVMHKAIYKSTLRNPPGKKTPLCGYGVDRVDCNSLGLRHVAGPRQKLGPTQTPEPAFNYGRLYMQYACRGWLYNTDVSPDIRDDSSDSTQWILKSS